MDKIRKQVNAACWRLTLNRFLGFLPWCLFATLWVAVLAIAGPKVFPFSVDSQVWIWSWCGGAMAAGVLSAMGITALRRSSRLDAAMEIDRRFQLKERISSMLSLGDDELKSEVGQALVHDALRRVERIDVRERFRLSLDRRAWLPLLPAALVFGLIVFVPDNPLDNPAQAESVAAANKNVKKTTDALRRKLAERKKKAEEKGLKDAEGLFKKLEEGARELNDKQDVDPKKALVKMNDLARELEKRQQGLGTSEDLKRQFNGLKDLGQGPGDKMAKALRDGDFNKALDELEKLRQKLQAGNLDNEEKQQLADQLDKMQQKLKQAADQHQQAMEAVQRQIEQAKAAGDKAQANKLQEQLDKLAQQAPQIDKLGQMADKLGQAAESMKKGDGQAAGKALDQLAEDLKGMQQALDEMEMIEGALDQIADAKGAMIGGDQGGLGPGKLDEFGIGGGKGRDKPGMGMGEGQGKGDRPEEKTGTSPYDAQVRQNVGRGRAVVTDLVDGPNVKGQVIEQIKSEMDAAHREAADPLSEQRLPRTRREHAREYFDAFREGQ